jgi:hypothetical protein
LDILPTLDVRVSIIRVLGLIEPGIEAMAVQEGIELLGNGATIDGTIGDKYLGVTTAET